jgi:RNA polymerase sigma-70 factor (ECF subfamily)
MISPPDATPTRHTAGPTAHLDFEAAALACLAHVSRFAVSLARDDADADDLVQETYLRAFRSRHTFQPDGDMRRWLFTICKHVFLRDRERREREVVSLDGDPTDETREAVLLHSAFVSSGEAALLERLDLAPAVADALRGLSAPLRMAVVLVDLEGYDYGGAADVMQVPIGTVRSRLFRGRRLLQESLVQFARDAGLLNRTPGVVA